MNLKIKKSTLYCFVFIIIPLIILQRFVSFYSLQGYDNGVFAYIGDMIRYGQIPYRDMWDHKTPLIYYLNAFSFSLFGSHMKSIAFMEILWIFAGIIFFYHLAKLIFEKKLSLKSTVLFTVYIASLKAVEEVGMTSVYLQICAVICIYFTVKYETVPKKTFLFLSGIFASFTFLFKQPGAMIIVPVLFYLGLDSFYKKKNLKSVLSVFLIWGFSFLLPITVLTVYFGLNNALPDAISQIFTFNFLYAKTDKNLFSLVTNFSLEMASNWHVGLLLMILGFLGFTKAGYNFAKNIKTQKLKNAVYKYRFFLLAVVWFAADWIAISYSERYYSHYFIQAIASLTLISTFALKNILDFQNRFYSVMIFIILFICSPVPHDIFKLAGSFKHPVITVNGLKYRDYKMEGKLIDFIQKNTAENEYIQFWGGQTRLHFITRRQSATKYNYLTPLLSRNYINITYISRFINELNTNKPKFIIDTCDEVGMPCLHDIQAVLGLMAFARFYIINNYKPYAVIDTLTSDSRKMKLWYIYKINE
jgi:hypothetical protein